MLQTVDGTPLDPLDLTRPALLIVLEPESLTPQLAFTTSLDLLRMTDWLKSQPCPIGVIATKVDKLEIDWPSGLREQISVPGVDRLLELTEGKGITKK